MKFRIQHFRYSGFVAIAYTHIGPRVLYKQDKSYAIGPMDTFLEPKTCFATTAEAEEACRAFVCDNDGGYTYNV